MATKTRKTEVGTLYFAGPKGPDARVRPADGRKFQLDELQEAVGGFFELLVPAERYTVVYANEEDAIKGLPPNSHTVEACNMEVYRLNGYGTHWRAAGNLLVVEKVDTADPRITGLPTITQALRDEGSQR
jgi:Domain of unknown function (DUF3846)